MEEQVGANPPKTDSQNLKLHRPKTEHQSPICLNNGLTHSFDILEVRVIVIGCDNHPPLQLLAVFSSFLGGAL